MSARARIAREGGEPDNRIRPGFTLIELLVVVGIIALLVAILLPALSEARREAKAVACATNQNHVGKAVALYLTRYRVFPASYVYMDGKGRYDFSDATQTTQGRNGYVHWSYLLYGDGKVDDKAFQCGEYDNGGAPRTNPGSDPSDWEAGQVDSNGQTSANSVEDRQARRMSYTANAAVMPRNKFSLVIARNEPGSEGAQRFNKFVSDSAIKGTGRTIMATEFTNRWQAIGVPASAGVLVKSHRPVNPFFDGGGGINEYVVPEYIPNPFRYGRNEADVSLGLMKNAEFANSTKSVLDDNATGPLNAIGRHHPGGDREFGGTANFLYCDGHVERKTVFDSLKKREWGEKYFSLTGNNDVLR